MNDRKDEEEARVLLYKLIYQVLIEIREEAFHLKSDKIHKLSTLVHNLPLQLLKSDRNHKELLEKVRDQAHSIEAGKWFENAIKQL